MNFFDATFHRISKLKFPIQSYLKYACNLFHICRNEHSSIPSFRFSYSAFLMSHLFLFMNFFEIQYFLLQSLSHFSIFFFFSSYFLLFSSLLSSSFLLSFISNIIGTHRTPNDSCAIDFKTGTSRTHCTYHTCCAYCELCITNVI